ncbi:class I SAM-dependent methyltransferase [Dehalobacterium formicoaceticum]|uniref:Class I SAM-dependent methyltransferase n=1 Tax=Dehalobacterium formicoaceticum TaxID=51515 RepID=A0ABT1Y4K1_9FIRM|nr:class I SAM-dependent methyltransferase [Dehalobacterium formicoaceticum]MCR6544839.1 class I SAM-dependent methyltransferase [Dehalobacterium formicoaceticum]
MSMEDIISKWQLKVKNKQASIDMWNSRAPGFEKNKSSSLEESSFLQLLETYKMLNPDASVLDVGCGTGSYTTAIARKCKDAIGLDFSPEMIEIAKRKAADERINNVEFRSADWHEIDLSEAGLEKRFDLVIARMTPAVQSAVTFQKLSLASKGWCVLSKATRRVDPVSDAVKKLVGIEERRESDLDIVYAFELLWYQGLQPRFEYEEQHWHLENTPEEAYDLYINRVKTYRDITSDEEQEIKDYLQSIKMNGLICEDIDTTITTLYWHV